MIDVIFSFGNETVLIRLDGSNIHLANSEYGAMMATIDGIRLSKSGVIQEFPDLINDDNWKAKAIYRFKEKLKSFSTEEERVTYVIEDLKKYGYKPMFKQQIGFRRVKI